MTAELRPENQGNAQICGFVTSDLFLCWIGILIRTTGTTVSPSVQILVVKYKTSGNYDSSKWSDVQSGVMDLNP